MLLKLAWRNLGRNRRRTIITTIGISLGLAMLVFSSVMGDGMHNKMIDYGVANQAGHVVVQHPEWQEKQEAELAVEGATALAQRLQALVPEGKVVQRVFVQGLLSSPRNSVGVALVGVQPSLEAEVGNLDEKMSEGRYLQDDDAVGVVIGKTLAETLEVGIGDKVVLMTQRDGDIESALFRIVGLFETGMQELDGFYAHGALRATQAALGLEDAVHQLSVHLPDPDLTDEVTARAKAALAAEPVVVLPWQQALPELYQFVVVDDGGLYVFVLIIAIVVAMGILNTVLMSVLERTREFGVVLAIGMAPGRLARLVLTEATLLGLIGTAIGLGVGLLASWPLIVYGLNYAALVGEQGTAIATAGVPLDLVIHGDISWTKMAVFCGLSIAMTVGSALYPVVKATQLRPVEAMHHH